jgi:hypothetical protein
MLLSKLNDTKIIIQHNKILKQNISFKSDFEITNKRYQHDPIILNEITKTKI